MPISVEQVSILIRINAFRFTGKNKRALLWEAHLKLGKSKGEERPLELFRPARKEYVLPTLDSSSIEEAFDQIEILGFRLRDLRPSPPNLED